jgi:hypothetical protein
MVRERLVERVVFGKGGEVRHGVYLSKELPDQLTGVFALTQGLDLAHRAAESLFRLLDGRIGVVLPLVFEAPVMLQKLFTEELRETLTRRATQRSGKTQRIDAGQATARCHFLD